MIRYDLFWERVMAVWAVQDDGGYELEIVALGTSGSSWVVMMGMVGQKNEITRIRSMEVRTVTRCPGDIVKLKQNYDALKPNSQEKK